MRTAEIGAIPSSVHGLAVGEICVGFRILAPLMIYPPVLRGRCPKAFREGTRGVWRAACGLWGFAGTAVWGRVLAGVVGGRSTIAVDNFSPPRRFWHARRHALGVWKHRGGRTPPVPPASLP